MTEKTEPQFKPKHDPTVTEAHGVGSAPSDWNPDAKPSDGSPVKTTVVPPPGYPRGWKPKSVAQHNAEVDEIAKERYPVK